MRRGKSNDGVAITLRSSPHATTYSRPARPRVVVPAQPALGGVPQRRRFEHGRIRARRVSKREHPLGPFLGNLRSTSCGWCWVSSRPSSARCSRAESPATRAPAMAKQSGLGRAGVSSRDIKRLPCAMDELRRRRCRCSRAPEPAGTLTKPSRASHVFGTHPRQLTCGMRASTTLVAQSAAASRYPLDFLVRLRARVPGEDAMPYPWKNSRTCSVHRHGLPRDDHAARHPAQRDREPGLVHPVHPLPGRDLPGAPSRRCSTSRQGTLDLTAWARRTPRSWTRPPPRPRRSEGHRR